MNRIFRINDPIYKMTQFTPVNNEGDENYDGKETELDDSKQIFAKLDPKDGSKDGRICKDTFLEWIDTLYFQATVRLEAAQGIPSYI
jgi:hypothetical protein